MGYDMDAASAVIVITVGTPLYEPRCAKARGIPGRFLSLVLISPNLP